MSINYHTFHVYCQTDLWEILTNETLEPMHWKWKFRNDSFIPIILYEKAGSGQILRIFDEKIAKSLAIAKSVPNCLI